MCKRTTTVKLAHADKRGCPIADVDTCIAPIVQALNDGGMQIDAIMKHCDNDLENLNEETEEDIKNGTIKHLYARYDFPFGRDEEMRAIYFHESDGVGRFPITCAGLLGKVHS